MVIQKTKKSADPDLPTDGVIRAERAVTFPWEQGFSTGPLSGVGLPLRMYVSYDNRQAACHD